MNIKIIETGEMHELKAIDERTGCEWTNDLIGNVGGLNDGQFTWDDDANAYLATADTYAWWVQYIADMDQTDADIRSLARELHISEDLIRERIAQEPGNDYDEHRSQAQFIMHQIRAEYDAND